MRRMLRKRLVRLGPFLLVFAGYFLAGKFDLTLASVNSSVSAVWAPAGIAVAALLFYGYDIWPAVFLAAFFVNVTTTGAALPSIVIAAGNTLEGLLGAYFVNRFANGLRAFDRAQDIFIFAAFAGFVSTAFAASIGTLTLFASGSASLPQLSDVWLTWWMGDAGGVLIIAPVLLLWFTNPKIEWNWSRVMKTLFFAFFAIFYAILMVNSASWFVYLMITPLFVWGSFYVSQREAALILFAFAEISLWGTVHGRGIFAENATTMNQALIFLRASMGATFVTIMALTATAVENHRVRATMSTYNATIEQEKAIDTAIIASVGDGLVVTDKEGTIRVVNPEAQALLGYSADELIGKKHWDAISMQDQEGVEIPPRERPLMEALSGKRVTTTPYTPTRYYARKDGDRFPVAFTKTPVVLEGSVVGAIEIFRNITKGKEIDRAKSDFVSLASHQLRTPLSVIAMYSELLKKQGSLFEKHNEEECREYAREINDAVRRMADLINDLLNVSRIDAQTLTVAPGPINLPKIIGHILHDMAPKIRKKELAVNVRYGKPLPEIVTDGQLLTVVIQNLVSNAVKYTPVKGRVTVVVGPEHDDVVISIADNGYGIPRDQQSEVFKKLFRAENVKQVVSDGSGLGLYIAKSMLERLGGNMSFSSEVGKGTTFIVRLPVDSLRAKVAEEVAWANQRSLL